MVDRGVGAQGRQLQADALGHVVEGASQGADLVVTLHGHAGVHVAGGQRTATRRELPQGHEDAPDAPVRHQGHDQDRRCRHQGQPAPKLKSVERQVVARCAVLEGPCAGAELPLQEQ